MPMVWVISSDSDTRRLIGLNLSKRGLCLKEMCWPGMLASSGVRAEHIILDVDPPDQSGWKQVKALRQYPRLPNVPLILILVAALAFSRLGPFQPVRWI